MPSSLVEPDGLNATASGAGPVNTSAVMLADGGAAPGLMERVAVAVRPLLSVTVRLTV